MRKYNIKEDFPSILELFNMKFGKKHDYLLVFNSYYKYQFAYNIVHFGKDPKYISSSDSLLSLYSFINRGMYKNDYPLPKTPLTEYLFDDADYYNLLDRFNQIDNKLKKQRDENIKKYSGIQAR